MSARDLAKAKLAEHRAKTRDAETPPTASAAQDRASAAADMSRDSAVVVTLADVAGEAVSWLWPRRIPCGMLSIVCGDGGVGKSTYALWCAAILSRGGHWPDGEPAPTGATILLTAEDSLAVTVKPRLDAMGADSRSIHALTAIPTGDHERPFSLDYDIPCLEAAIRAHRAALVMIDPLGAYFGKGDSYKDTEIRAVLAPLARLAERTGAAIVAIMHIGKTSERAAQHRVLGGVGFVNAARLVLGIGRHPDDEEGTDRRVLIGVKENICLRAAPLAFRLTGAALEWEPEPLPHLSADQVLNPRPLRRRPESLEDAKVFLLERLKGGPVPTEQLVEEARQGGIATRTLERAKAQLGVEAFKPGFHSKWYWRLSANTATNAANPSVREELAAFVDTPENSSQDGNEFTKAANSLDMRDGGGLREVPDPESGDEAIPPSAPAPAPVEDGDDVERF